MRKRIEGRAIPCPATTSTPTDHSRALPREITFETLGQYAFYDAPFDDAAERNFDLRHACPGLMAQVP